MFQLCIDTVANITKSSVHSGVTPPPETDLNDAGWSKVTIQQLVDAPNRPRIALPGRVTGHQLENKDAQGPPVHSLIFWETKWEECLKGL